MPGIVQVTVDHAAHPPATTTDPAQVLAPNTTSEQDRQAAGLRDAAALKTHGQRHINMMWERTQQVIAIVVTIVLLAVCSYVIVYGTPELKLLAFSLLSNIGVLVIGTYFQRTNHVKSSGDDPSNRGTTT